MSISPVAARVLAACIVSSAASVPSIARAAENAVPGSAFAKGPYLQALGAASVVVRVELATEAGAKLEISESTAEGGKATAGALSKPLVFDDVARTTMHSIRARGLASKTHYDYVVRAAGQSRKGTFTTAPNPDSVAPFSFAIYGDNRTDEVAHAAVVRAISASRADFLVHTGDFVQDGASPADWQSFFDVESSLLANRCVFSCVGNHELTDANGAAYLRYFAPTHSADDASSALHDSGVGPAVTPAITTAAPALYGSFRWGNARFFLLNAMDAWDSGTERTWLESELTQADDEAGLTWRIVVLHHSPWSAGPHGGNPRMLRAGIPALLSKHKIDLVVGGHDHIYERGFEAGLRYLVTGGGGAPLYRVEAPLSSTRKVESSHHYVEATVTTSTFELAATRVDGTLIEKCAFSKTSAAWDCDPKPEIAVVQPASVAHVVSSGDGANAAKSSGSRCGCRIVGRGAGQGDRGDRPNENAAAYLFASCAAGIAIVARRRARRSARL